MGITGQRIVFPEIRKAVVEEFTVEKPSAAEVLVKSVSSSIDGTEIVVLTGRHTFSGVKGRWPSFPFYPGDSTAGIVEEVGEEAETFCSGDRVWTHGHASYVRTRAEELVRIPDGVTFDEAAVSPHVVSMYGSRIANFRFGESAVILGQGIVGQYVLQLARLSGADPVIAVDLSELRLGISRMNGATYIVNASRLSVEDEVMRITQGRGVNVVVECTGNPKVMPQAFKIAALGGRIVMIGSMHGTVELDLYTEVQRKQLTLYGLHASHCPSVPTVQWPWTRRMEKDLALSMIAKGVLKAEPLITHRVHYREAPAMYAKMAESTKDVLGVILNWKGSSND